jgi:hypothetical protein
MALLEIDSLSIDDVSRILECEQSKAVKRIHQPKGRQVFIVDTEDGRNSEFMYCYVEKK